jgi:hypothetical protein
MDRRWWNRIVELFTMEVQTADGSRYLVALDPTGFAECWVPINALLVVNLTGEVWGGGSSCVGAECQRSLGAP